ncbi:MAG TPA: hypothetical protein VJ596_06630 [Gemmatimonadaceae bacterium]|nr:hypothetical protein [Gemmatimonadaceae bacterium]
MADRRRRVRVVVPRAEQASTRRNGRVASGEQGAKGGDRAHKRHTTNRGGAKRAAGAKVAREPGTPVRLMRIRALDPHAACGSGTTVMQLYRVDDLPTESAATHLVFFDRHGWYCEHGRDCPAVAAVRKHTKQTI